MPQDSHEIFAALSDAEKKALLPADSVAEYLKDGQPAAKDDPKECVVDGKYVRPLRDYDVLFRADQEKRILLTDSIDAATRDKKLAQEALALAQKQADACTRDIAAAKEELDEVAAQRELVADYLAKFQKALETSAGGHPAKAPREPGQGRPDRQVAVGGRRADRPAHPCHGPVRYGEAIAAWASTIATITARCSGPDSLPTPRETSW